MSRYAHVYLSPHLDDAALSCGGRIWLQAQAGERVLVVTVFAGCPAPQIQLSPFAQAMYGEWGLSADASAARQREDVAAMALLGAEPVHWPYADCIYRQTPDGRFPYDSEEALWGDVHPADESLVLELAVRFAELAVNPGGTLYTPLTVGHHVDHQIVRRAAEASGHGLVYYEDYPYAQDLQALEAVVAGDCYRPEPVLLSPEALEARISAIARYTSQVSFLWADADEMAAAVRAIAARTGDGTPAERYWKRGA